MDTYQADYASAWAELTGYVQQAQEDGHPINADALMQYMTELKRRVLAPTREALAKILKGGRPDA